MTDPQPAPTHFMVDIETLGTTPGSAITSIGLVQFDPRTRLFGTSFYREIKPEGDMDPGAIAFWLKQGDEARTQMIRSIEEGVSLKRALHEMHDRIIKYAGEIGNVRLWGNGATFDNVLLDAAYARTGHQVPWRYSGHRCFRTLVSLVGEKLPVEREGVHHNALDDAMYQVKVLFAAMDRLGLKDLH